MAPVKLVIFDYSGTLSLESILFARPDSLMQHLRESGLAHLGIESPETFWREIVNPSWQKGSTTPVGYTEIIRKIVSARHSRDIDAALRARISSAASSFVESYLRHSYVDARWQPILTTLQSHPSVKVIVATDHYAEATGYIIRFLHELRIQAVAAKDAFAGSDSSDVVVACSADIGVHKTDSRFWEVLKNGLPLREIRSVLFIDDFGCNEQKEDSYSAAECIEQRKCETLKVLQTVFSSAVQIVPFMMMKDGSKRTFDELIMETSAIVSRFLAGSGDR